MYSCTCNGLICKDSDQGTHKLCTLCTNIPILYVLIYLYNILMNMYLCTKLPVLMSMYLSTCNGLFCKDSNQSTHKLCTHVPLMNCFVRIVTKARTNYVLYVQMYMYSFTCTYVLICLYLCTCNGLFCKDSDQGTHKFDSPTFIHLKNLMIKFHVKHFKVMVISIFSS